MNFWMTYGGSAFTEGARVEPSSAAADLVEKAGKAESRSVTIREETDADFVDSLIAFVQKDAARRMGRLMEEVDDASRFYAASPELDLALRFMAEPMTAQRWGETRSFPKYVPRRDSEGKMIPYPEVSS